MSHLILGRKGELLACQYLLQNGHKIREMNWRFRKWEIDIISETESFIHFVEVKTRRHDELLDPIQAVTKKKQRNLIQAADHYLRQKGIQKEAKMDIIGITHCSLQPKFEYFEEAFTT